MRPSAGALWLTVALAVAATLLPASGGARAASARRHAAAAPSAVRTAAPPVVPDRGLSPEAQPASLTPGYNWVEGLTNQSSLFPNCFGGTGWTASYVGYYPMTDASGVPTGEHPKVGETYYMHMVVAEIGNLCVGGDVIILEVGLPSGTQLAISDSTPVKCWYVDSGGTSHNVTGESTCPRSAHSGTGAQLDISLGYYPVANGAIYEVQFPVTSSVPLSGMSYDSASLLHGFYQTSLASPPAGAVTVPVYVPAASGDTTPPDTTITSGPPASTASTSATFSFTSTEPGSTFECQIDGSVWESPCVSPRTFVAVSQATHHFQVRARDAAGNVDATPATWTWTVTPPPTGCTFNEGLRRVYVNMPNAGDALTLRRSGSSFLLNGASVCGAATVTNTDSIYVIGDISGPGASQTLTIDLSGGAFAPGATSEPNGAISAIEISVNLGLGADTLRIVGGAGADTILVGGSAVNLDTDSDWDIQLSSEEVLSVDGGGGNDSISAVGGGATGLAFGRPITIWGSAGDDTLCGGAGDDALYGGAGNDTFTDGIDYTGADTFSGGPGTDTMSYESKDWAVHVTTSDGLANDGLPDEGDSVKADIEVVRGGAYSDTLTGGPNADTLYGGGANDTINGGGGADTISGGDGNDTLNGGDGNDLFDEGAGSTGADVIAGGAGVDQVSYSSRTTPVSVTLADGVANDGQSGEGDLVRVDVENVSGGSGSDTLTGSAAANVIAGGAGNDAVYSGDGNDTLYGDAGSDTLYGGTGNDVFDEGFAANGADVFNGGAGVDTLSYGSRAAAVAVTLADATANDGAAGEGDLARVDVENVTGGAGGDTLTGSSVANIIRGGGGSDTIYGGAGNDTLYGDAGSDSLYGGDGNDAFYAADSTADYLNGGNGNDTADACDSGLDTLVGIENTPA